jgi:hypothetical protein
MSEKAKLLLKLWAIIIFGTGTGIALWMAFFTWPIITGIAIGAILAVVVSGMVYYWD